MSRKLWLSLRRLLQVHKSGDCGSPRVVGSTRERRSSMRLASIALIGLRPPPNRRTRSASTAPPARNSLSARPTVLRASPVARDTAAIPPCPAVIASAAANRRRPRSSSTGSSASNRWRMVDSSITPPYYRQLPDEGILPPRNFRVEEIQLFADDALVIGAMNDAKSTSVLICPSNASTIVCSSAYLLFPSSKKYSTGDPTFLSSGE